jgi:hypothetical protein
VIKPEYFDFFIVIGRIFYQQSTANAFKSLTLALENIINEFIDFESSYGVYSPLVRRTRSLVNIRTSELRTVPTQYLLMNLFTHELYVLLIGF